MNGIHAYLPSIPYGYNLAQYHIISIPHAELSLLSYRVPIKAVVGTAHDQVYQII